MLSRRRFALLGGTAAACTLIGARFGERIARAAPAGPLRFLAVRTPHGVDRNLWIPRTTSGAEPGSADEALSGLTFEYENSILDAMMPWRDQITVLDGLDTQCVKEGTRAGVRTFHGHNEQGTLLTGAQPPEDRESGNFDNHPSLDFFLHGLLGAPVLLNASVEGAGTWKCMSFDAAGMPREPETSPSELFQQAFPADFVPPDPGDPMVDYTAGEQRIVTHGQNALKALEARLQGVEKEKIAAHREAMAKLATTTKPPMVGYCTTKGTDVPGVGGGIGDYTVVETVARAHAAVIAQAFACGRSMCATLRILDDYPNHYTEVPEVQASGAANLYGADFRFHENLVHDYWGASGATLDTLRKGYTAGLRWAAGHFAAVLDELSKVIDPFDPNGGTMLDNTIVFWHSEFGHDGHDNQHTRHPAIIAGGGNRTLRLGRYLRLRNIESEERVPHNLLLTSICHALGRTEINFFGDRDLDDRPEYQGPLEPLMV